MPDIKTPAEILEEMGQEPGKKYNLVYDSSSESLEPVYFWILDLLNNSSDSVEKLVDNFASSPGSGHFSELMAKGTRMQEEAMKIYGLINTVIKSILTIIYDLREFQIRLKSYDDANSSNKSAAQAGLLSLKQIWMDQVDIKRGRGSINMLVQDLNFVTLRDAFMAADSIEEADKMDLNDRVKRILKERVHEFLEWKKRSEAELRKRFEIEKTYLKTQVATVKMYSRWVKPYLKAAEELRMTESADAALVKAFNTLNLELAILAKSKIKVRDAAANHDLPEELANIKMRDYYSCVLVDFKFRGIPQKFGQHYAFGGRVDVTFSPYALTEQEIKLLKRKLEESDMGDSLKLITDMTEESLGQLKLDIDEFLEEKEAEEERIYQAGAEKNVNPFAALIGLGIKKPKTAESKEKSALGKGEEIKSIKDIKKDSYAERIVRKYAEKKALDSCHSVYDLYKKGHGMASAPPVGRV